MTELLRERYEPLEVVGEGGEGRVLRALDHLHDRQVALKIRIAPEGAVREELLREARVLLSLDPHPGLPLVREDFFEGGDYVIAMDWIEGIDLGRLLAERGTPGLAPTTVLRQLAQVAEALTHLHTHDPPVVHGDVKPANLVLARGGKVVLVDFGLAASGATRASMKGTLGFVAPEIAAGSAPTPASDLYSLAMTAFTLLTGSPPAGGKPAWPAGFDEKRARVFEQAIALGTAVDPDRRPSSVGEFLEYLRAGWEADLPTGVLTFVMTDIDGSSTLWESHTKEMSAALIRHDGIIAQTAESHGGRLIKSMGEGDSSVSVFTGAGAAVVAAAEIVQAIDSEPWPDGISLRVRAGVHTGEAELRGGDYFGPAVNRTARIRGQARGGQLFLSEVTAGLVGPHMPEGFGLVDLGSHQLRGAGEREHLFAVSAPSLTAPPSPQDCPYRGLLAFEPEDQDLFFGREDVLARVLERLAASSFLALVGASGSGKSSLVRAGLIPAARRGEIAGINSAILITPGSDPARALDAILDGDRQLLVVDQFEEVFTLCDDEATRTEFFDRLLEYKGRVVVSLRADFYGHCAAHEGLARLVSAEQVLLGPMRPDEMRQAIENPARSAELRLESGLADVVLRDAAGEAGALPLLSHALLETWARRDGRTLTIEGYSAAGGVRGAIARTAEDVFGHCSESERRLAKQIFLRLTELGEGTDDSKRRARLSELVPEEEGSEARHLIEKLTRARLLTVDDESVEVAHEALIREWPRLGSWLGEDREGLRLHRHLTQSAQAWERTARDPGELYRGARLTAALDWSGDGAELTTIEREFLDASRGAQEAELHRARAQTRRLRRMLSGVAVALVAAILAGSLAVVSRANAQRATVVAQSGRLAIQSRESAVAHPDLGLLLALESGRMRQSVETRGALLGALEHSSRLVAQLQGLTAPPSAVAFSPEGKLMMSVGVDGTTVWDVQTRRALGKPLRSAQGGWEGADFSPDGRLLAIGGQRGIVELWDVATRRKLRELKTPPGSALQDVGFSPNGKVLAASGREDNHVTLFDVTTGRALGAPIAPHAPGTSAGRFAFSRDSKRILLQTETGLRFWTVANGRPASTPFVAGDGPTGAQTFSRDGREIAGVDDSGSVSLWDARTGARIGEAIRVGEENVTSVDLSPDARLIAAGTESGTVLVWDARTGTPYGTPLIADAASVWDLEFSPDGRLLGSVHGRSVALWDMTGEQAIGHPLGAIGDVATDVAFRPDGKQVALGRYDSSIGIVDAATRKELARIPVGSIVYSVRYSPDGRLIATGSIDGKVRFWDAATRAPAGPPLDTGAAFVWQIAFSPDGTLLAAAVDPNGPRNIYEPDRQGEAQLWNVASRRRTGKSMVPGKHSILSVAFSPDGKVLATGSFEERTELWNVVDQTPLGKPMDLKEDGVAVVAFAPDGRRVVAAGVGVRIWNEATQQLAVPPLAAGADPITGAAYDPSGRFLATTSLASGTRLWDPTSGLAYGDELPAAPRPESLQPSVDVPLFPPVRNGFSPDGRYLVTAGVAARAMIWDLNLATWRARACEIAGRNLTREEWRVYLPPGSPYRATCAQWPAA